MRKFCIPKKREGSPDPVPSKDPDMVAVTLCRYPNRICIHRYSQEAELLCLAENRKVRRAARCGKGAKS